MSGKKSRLTAVSSIVEMMTTRVISRCPVPASPSLRRARVHLDFELALAGEIRDRKYRLLAVWDGGGCCDHHNKIIALQFDFVFDLVRILAANRYLWNLLVIADGELGGLVLHE